MIDAVVFSGNEEKIEERIEKLFEYGISEIIFSIVTTEVDSDSSYERSLELLSKLAQD